MAGQSFLLQLGARLATLGSAASLAVAFPTVAATPYAMSSHTDANRTGLYATMGAGTESIHLVTGGVDGANFTHSGTVTNLSVTGSITSNLLTATTFHPTAGSAASASAMSFGVSLAEGLQLKVIEETVDFGAGGGAAAKYRALTTAIPAGAIIIGAETTTKTLVVAGGTSVKIALGQHAGTVNKYGVSADLAANTKITTPTDWIVNAGEQIDVCLVVAAGNALGDTNGSAGTVRVRLYYFLLNALDN